MGPSMDLTLRRSRAADVEVQKQAFKQPRLTKKKVRPAFKLNNILLNLKMISFAVCVRY